MKDFRKIFKSISTNKQATAADHVEYFILKAMTAKTNNNRAQIASDMIFDAFNPVTNENKLTNGMHPYLGLQKALLEASVYQTSLSNIKPQQFSTRPLLECIENDMELKLYQNIWNEIYDSYIKEREPLDKDYVFFFVDKTLPLNYQAVQAAHAALVLGTKERMKSFDVTKLNFVVCHATKDDLLTHIPFIVTHDLENVDYVEFREPDLGNRVTCVATTPIPYSHKGVFSHYDLMNFDTVVSIKNDNPFFVKTKNNSEVVPV